METGSPFTCSRGKSVSVLRMEKDIMQKCQHCERGYYAQAIFEFNCVICGRGPAPLLPWDIAVGGTGSKPETNEQIEAALADLRRRCGKPTAH